MAITKTKNEKFANFSAKTRPREKINKKGQITKAAKPNHSKKLSEKRKSRVININKSKVFKVLVPKATLITKKTKNPPKNTNLIMPTFIS